MSLSYKSTVMEDMKTIQICVDSYHNRNMKGLIYHPLVADGRHFDNVMQLLLLIEHILDEMDFPRAMQEFRSFSVGEVSKAEQRSKNVQRPGEFATFYVRMAFRQNASWQGTVTWCEGGDEVSFRSALELLFLMDGALSADKS